VSILRNKRFWQYIVIFLICLFPFVFLLYQARYSPKIEFLFPSLKGDWILHSAEKASGTVEFRRQFKLEDVPQKCRLRVRAMMQYSMSVNGQVIEANSQYEKRNWKQARIYNIKLVLKKGDNSIVIWVNNPEGPPALLVEGMTLKSPKGKTKLSSNTDWKAASEPDFNKWISVVPTLTDEARLGEKKGPIQNSPGARYPVYMIIFGAYLLFILLAVNPLQIFYRLDTDFPQRRDRERSFALKIGLIKSSRFLSLAPLIAIIIIILVINIHNVANYSYQRRGFDWGGHVDYIRYMASKWRTPIATEGWEMFQPPLYYFLSAIIYKLFGGVTGEPGSLKAVQIMGTLAGVANACFALLVLRKLFKRNLLIQLLGFSLVAFLPMCFYMNPLISNEIFAGSVISFAIYTLIRYGFEEQIKIRHALIMGLAVGLAMLSKYTATFVFLAAVVTLIIRIISNPSTRRREVVVLAAFLIAVFAISGWLYIRNLAEFHDPFIGNWDKKSGYHYEQHHGYRTLGFYLKFGSVFLHTPERSRWASFWDGKYGSMWMDSHGSFLRHNNEKANLYGSIIIYLALLPSVAIVLGFYQSLKSAFGSARSRPDLALVVVSSLTIISLISFTMEVPFFSTIKAFFFLSLLPAIAVFAGKGLYTMSRNLGKFRFIIYANLIMLYLLIINLFWYRGT